jgi:hypothetical protein
MNFFKKYNSVIKSLLIIIIILLLVYIFLLNVPVIKEGKVSVGRVTRSVRRGTSRTVDTVGGGINQGVDTVGGGVSQGWNNIKDETTQITGEVTGVITGMLADVLNKLKSAVNSLSSKFSQINNEIIYTQTLSGNFGTNTNNAINNLALIDTPKSNTSLSKIVGGVNNTIMSVKPVASEVLTGAAKSILKKKKLF